MLVQRWRREAIASAQV